MKRKPSEKEIIEEKNHPEEEFSSEDNDGYEFSEENQAEEEELNEPHESSDHTESEDSEIKQILEMRIPVIGKKTYEEEESY
ncbi:hypothetical protein TRFO_08293 [Tritrichomonas foetus]|uniref:Uncharacterized protein n=1 Tax=Tritrichomonas foetus TaxID=1144522 RepID=A0A1J4JKM1_9EUKA|nr:hypothetical protein TRFO_08293 [Tritrichomonas foetus]|eukprot:OHS99662.1 hypothetical protein TRFO_08293 [Tritrichomonas foetus]